ncbi:MAG: hypothetical protein KDD45_05675, partial [Bdellovibrionales bacterium]|nr:hypothetical protein [Bdellovibrionales bacterium]
MKFNFFLIILGALILKLNSVMDTAFIDIKRNKELVCVNEYTKYFSFGNNSQIADIFWIRFLQETDAYNEGKIASYHLCKDNVTSWHFHILNIAMD